MASSIAKARQIRQYLSPILQHGAYIHTVCDSAIMRNAPTSGIQHSRLSDNKFSSSKNSIRPFSAAAESSIQKNSKATIENNEESKSAPKVKPRRLSEVR